MQPDSAFPLRQALAGMIALAVAMGIGRFVYTPILPGMMDGLGLSASQAGFLASANFLGYLVGAVVAGGGWAEGRERAVTLGALAASAALCAWMGLAGGVGTFAAIRFLAGLASAFVMVILSNMVFASLATAGRGDLQAVHFGGVGLGIAVSALMTAGLGLADADWRAGWYWSAALSAAGLVAVMALLEKGPRPEGPPAREPRLPRRPAFLRIILAYGLFGFGYIVTATFLVAIVRQQGGGGLFESVVWLVTGLAGLPSVWLWSRLAARIGLTATFAAGCLVEAVGVAASVSLGGHAGPLVGGILVGGTFIALTALGLRAGRQLGGPAPRRALAAMTAAFGTGQILGPVVAGYAADRTGGFAASSALAAAALALAAAVAWRSDDKDAAV